MTEPPAEKRLKAELSRPAFKSGILSASRSAGFEDGEDPVIIPVARKDKSYFFPAGYTFDSSFKISCPFNLWTGDLYSEDSVRNDIYTVLLAHQTAIGIEFPKSSFAGSTGGISKYAEKELKTIFTQHAKKHAKNEHMNYSVKEKEQGLLLKLTSKPDICILRGREIIVGEIKQKPNYDMSWAKRQCSVYCYGVLYYYRVILGIPVDRVFGFWVCGPNCKDLKKNSNNKYAVGIMEVQAPTALGEIFTGKQYMDMYDLTSNDGLKLLLQFLKDGKIASIEKKLQVSIEDRGPHHFSLPSALWEQKGFSIVKGGTSAMVFKLSTNQLVEFLRQNVTGTKDEEEWEDFVADKVTECTTTTGLDCVYLKIRTKDTSVRFNPSFKKSWSKISQKATKPGITEAEREAFGEFLGTYIVEPYEDEYFCLCLMADRGRPLQGLLATGKVRQLLRDELDRLKLNAKLLCEHIIHGDILLHNVVMDDDNSLHLIDFDEGVISRPGTTLSRRYPVFGGELNWFQAMFYPNSLRHFVQRYSQVQLLAFMYLALYAGESTEVWDKDCTSMMEELGTLLHSSASADDNGWEYVKESGEAAIPSRVLELIEELWNLLPMIVANTTDL